MTEGYKLHPAERPKRKWLFNLTDDPTEQNNIAADNRDLVAWLSSMIDLHNTEQVEPSWPALVESPQFIDKTAEDDTTVLDEHVYWPN